MSAARLRAPAYPPQAILLGLIAVGVLMLGPVRSADALESRAVGDVEVPSGTVREEAYTVFGDVTVEGGVEGDVRCAFGDVVVRGPVGGEVKTGFGNVYVDAPVRGSVDVGYGNVSLGPRAHVGDNLSQGNGESQIDPAAVVDGDMRYGMMSSDSPLIDGGVALANLTLWLLTTLGFCAAAMLFAVLARRPLGASARSLEHSPGRAALWGVVSLPMAAFFSVLLAITVIGMPLLLLAVPAYLALAVFGALVAAYCLGRRLLVATGQHRGGEAFASAVGAFAISVVYLVPVVGGAALFLLALLGVGAAICATIERLKGVGEAGHDAADNRGGEEPRG